MLRIEDGTIINKSHYTSSGTGVTYYTLHVAVMGCSDMIDIGVDQARYTQAKLMEPVESAVGYSRGRFEFVEG